MPFRLELAQFMKGYGNDVAIIVVERHRPDHELEGICVWGSFAMTELLTYRSEMKRGQVRTIHGKMTKF